MWNNKLKNILQRFVNAPQSGEIETFFAEHTQAGLDIDATIGLNENDIYDTNSSVTFEPIERDHNEQTAPYTNLSQKRYRTVDTLGQGGMATVWQVQDNHLLRTVALKQLRKDKAASAYEQESFMVEAQVTAQLQHPGIVPIHDLQRDDNGNVQFTMREIKGQTLEDIIDAVHEVSTDSWQTTKQHWNLRRLIEAIDSVCQTLAYAHSRGVIHQDIKPANIMIGHYGEVLVVDWGVARIQSLYHPDPNWVQVQATSSYIEYKREAVSGTPRYMAPEQIYGNPAHMDGRADIYALGVTLFYILTKEKPFSMPLKEIFKVKQDRGLSLKEWIDNHPSALAIPTALINICERAMAQNPADRFQDAKEMQRACKAWLDGKEQESKAHDILRDVDSLQDSVRSLEFEAQALIEQLNTPTLDDTTLSDDWWHNWVAVQDIQEQISDLQDLIYQKVQGASLYTTNIPAIYELLVKFEYQEYLHALAEENPRAISSGKRRFETYLAHLSSNTQIHWNNRLSLDTASLQSRKNGIHIDRISEQDTLFERLAKNTMVTVVGLAGIGKTHLAWQVATAWAREHHWQTYFCDASGCTTLPGLLQRIASALGLHKAKTNLYGLITRILNCDHIQVSPHLKGSFLIVDNAEELNAKAIKLLSKIQTDCPNIRILVTSQRVLNTPKEVTFTIPPMSFMNGLELFIRHCKHQLPSWSLTPNNSHQVLQLINLLHRNPLNIELAGARSAMIPLQELLSQLQQEYTLVTPSYQQNHAHSTLQWSLQSLSPLERDVITQLSVIQGPFNLTLANACVSTDIAYSTSDILDILTNYNLLNREFNQGQFQFRILHSVRQALQRQAQHRQLEEMCHRIATYAVSTIEQEIPVNRSILQLSALQGQPEDACRCCQFLLSKISKSGPITTGLEIAELFLARTDLANEHRRPIQLLEIDLLRAQWDNKTILQKLQGLKIKHNLPNEEVPEDELAEPSPFMRSHLPKLSQTTNIQVQYKTLIRQDKWHQAILCAHHLVAKSTNQIETLQQIFSDLQKAGRLRQALGVALHIETLQEQQHLSTLHTVIDIAVVLTRLSHKSSALKRYIKAEQLAKQAEDYDSLGRILGNRGLLHQSYGEYATAQQYYQQSKRLFAQRKNTDKVGTIEGNLGTLHYEMGQYKQAAEHFTEALRLAKKQRNQINEGVFLGNLGRCIARLGQQQKGISLLQKAVIICDQVQPFAAGAFRGELAYLLSESGMLNNLQGLLSTGSKQLREHKEEYGKFLCLEAQTRYNLGDVESIRNILLQAEQICEDLQTNNHSSLCKALRTVQQRIPPTIWLSQAEIAERQFKADVLFRWGRHEEFSIRYPSALHYLTQAKHIYTVLHQEPAVLKTRLVEASVHLLMGHLDIAHKEGLDILQYHRVNGNTLHQGIANNFMGKCLRRMGKLQESLAAYQESIRILSNDVEENTTIHLASTFQNAGNCCSIMGDTRQALLYLNKSLELSKQNNLHIGNNYCAIALCHQNMGDEEKAIRYYQLGIKELRFIGDTSGETIYQINLALILQRQGKFRDAENMFTKLIPLAKSSQIPINQCIAIGNYGILLYIMDRYPESSQQLEQAIKLAKQCSPLCHTVFTANLAYVHSLQGNTEQATTLLDSIDAESIRGHIDEYIKLLCLSAEIHHNASLFEKSQSLFQQATRLKEKHNFHDKTQVTEQWKRTDKRLAC